MDLEKLFDKVNHDKRMTLLSKRIEGKPLLKLIHRYLRTGMLDGGLIQPRDEGTPQGSPLSPILSDELDKVLDSRGLWFVRYADDVSIYVKSKCSVQRVLRSVTEYIEQVLLLKVNKEKSKVSRPMRNTLLGFTFGKLKGEWKPLISDKSKKHIKEKIKAITSRRKSINMQVRLTKLSQITIG